MAFDDWNAIATTANEMHCVRFVPLRTSNGMTAMSWGYAIDGSQNMGAAVYSSDGSTRIATSGAVAVGAPSSIAVKNGISSFNLTAGTSYLECWCSDTSGGGSYRSLSIETAFGDIVNSINASADNFVVAANSCSAAVPPTTTGALTAQIAWAPMIISVY